MFRQISKLQPNSDMEEKASLMAILARVIDAFASKNSVSADNLRLFDLSLFSFKKAK